MCDYSYILGLPAEVRLLIYNQIPQKELVHNLRLVCKQFRAEIDEMCSFHVDLDDRKHCWERVLQLRIRSCKILHFLRPPPGGPGTTILKHPYLLRTLKITEHISPSNLYYLLSDCCRSLGELRLHIGFNLLGYEFPPLSTFSFERLQRLEIIVSTVGSSSSDAFPFSPFINSAQSKVVQGIFTEFLLNIFKLLSVFKIQIRCFGFGQVSNFVASVLVFLGSHSGTIEGFDFELILGHGLPSAEFQPISETELERIDFQRIRNLRELKALRVVSSSPIGVNLWIDLVTQQVNLNFLEVDLFPANCSIFRDVINRNCGSLVSVEITDLSVWDEEGNCSPFDCTIFGGCLNLKKLILDRNVTRRRMFDTAELINLFNLPSSLDEMALNYFNILSDELILFTNSESGQNIRTLYLTQCGNSGLYGVDGTVLERIIELPKIHFIEISPLNFSDPEEQDKLNIILDTFGYSENHSYFQLTKTTHEFPISLNVFSIDSESDDEEFMD
ncbi:unnamed protein product [Allacma fusca]|uniref:F-box domain-containing protein n=1 Tax=Allacma fusca TaxID=39272 RepID=A0A8J2JDQ7_9HEXA|nr:unnamed protein product [Allacma fusca]